MWTGRITRNKGLHEAVQAAKLAGAQLDIAGPIEDQPYFNTCMDAARGADIRYLGQFQGERLRRLVRRARAALVTPMWDEPFGLVAAEALASGVPVVAFDRGAMREVVGPCGVLVDAAHVGKLAEAIGSADRIDRTACRERARTLFSTEAMIEGYLAAYFAAIHSAERDAARTSASSRSSTVELLA